MSFAKVSTQKSASIEPKQLQRRPSGKYRRASVHLLDGGGGGKQKRGSKRRAKGGTTTQLSKAWDEYEPVWRQVDDYIQQNASLDDICFDMVQQPIMPRLELDGVSVTPGVRVSRATICVEHCHFPLVAKIAKQLGYTHVPEHRLWNVQWSDGTPHMDQFKALKRFQQINHFPGISEICRKDLLSRNLNRMLKLYPGDYRIFPKTWLLPTDAYDVASYASRHKRTYILKPYSAGQGRGIWLATDLKSVSKRDKLICQTYLERPLLIDGYKFDLRVYTLITSVDPLRIFVYNEGLSRFATHKYVQPTMSNSHNVYMHLTNYCLNRRNSKYDMGGGDEGGSKRNLGFFNKWMKTHGYDPDEFWASVDDAIIKTVISALPTLKHNYNICFPRHDKIKACFQLLGFDILVDWKLKPYILEVNHSPSLFADQQVDHDIKRPLIRDTLSMLTNVLVDKEQIIREDRTALKKRLMRQVYFRKQGAQQQGRTPPKETKESSSGMRRGCSLSALAQQIAWEESHLGNYRRVMPPRDSEKVNYYCKFYEQSSPKRNATMYAETASSRHRELLARQQIQKQRQQHLVELRKQVELKPSLKWVQKKLPHLSATLANTRTTVGRAKPRVQKLCLRRVKEQQKEGNKVRSRIGERAQLLKEAKLQKQMLLLRQGSSNVLRSNISLNKRIKSVNSLLYKKYKSNNSLNKKTKPNNKKKSKRQRELELEAQGDAKFVAEHSVRQPGGTIPQITLQNNSPISIPTNFINRQETQENISYETQWMPQPIHEEEEAYYHDWRRERNDEVEHSKFKEQIFTQMFRHGQITKTDIKVFPFMLYKILQKNPNRPTVQPEQSD